VTTFKRTTGFLALTACLLAAGCGSDEEGEPIPANIAGQLQTRLAEVERRFEFGNGACADIQNDSLPAVEDLLTSIPENVDADVRQGLAEGFDRLFVLTEEQCEQTQTETEPAPAPEPVPTDTTETTPPPTETTPPPTETEEPPPVDTETEPAPGEGGDAPGGEGGSGQSGQGGDAPGVQGGTGGGALVPGDEG
jgi:hypothetical protein